ncbi:hypothetical protein LYNGBM3L_45190 [Moorena producens 3L]|uniref:Uncharacterized protein n=1 Tax=Moorena producens 3L TaxID=489825 RepID=F4XX50_9CYAN|nr:hypothetical protein LYNGBM3L_45190 [Moorena producens 3L]
MKQWLFVVFLPLLSKPLTTSHIPQVGEENYGIFEA